ncbi:hypothetical protein B0H17DRAFT_297686 [Mycena rosella]|uniref:Uncharacterized protein n=1 Tax=Mycena rosella TaxID=1033263 RepID=A0AAD7GPR0_MYCRO|nr:hypothetical protein B0H17DRAFT_297686 [Mycena rosella]
MSSGPTFTGSGTSAAAAIDFLKDVRLGFSARGPMTDLEKLEEVGDRFRHGTPADVWFKATQYKKWADFQNGFEQRFAGLKPIVKPRAQLLAELSSMRITVGQLAAGHVLVGGEKVAPLVEFHAQSSTSIPPDQWSRPVVSNDQPIDTSCTSSKALSQQTGKIERQRPISVRRWDPYVHRPSKWCPESASPLGPSHSAAGHPDSSIPALNPAQLLNRGEGVVGSVSDSSSR